MKTSRIYAAIIVFAVVFFNGFAGVVLSAGEQVHKDEMGLLRLKIINPASNSALDDPQPVIGADASQLESLLDTNSVTITVDGADVTENAEITSGYIAYRPPAPLLPGRHEVRITAKDVNKKNIEPLSWIFTVKGEAPEAVSGEQDRTKGSLNVSTDFVKADYTPQSAVDVSGIFAEKNGTKLNADLTFSNVSTGRTILGSFHRETQLYTDIEIDKFRMDYSDSNFNASLGNFWMALSDLSVAGTELAGARIDRNINRWRFSLFSGRTQDPSVSGSYKQAAAGLKTIYDWNSRHSTSVTVLTADETGLALATSTLPLPARDSIVDFIHEYKFMDNMKASLEYAMNNRREKGMAAAHDDAMQLTIAGNYKSVWGELAAYDLGENFYPVAEGNYKYLKNDREGFRGKATWQALDFFRFGGEYEQYDTNSTDQRTRRGSAFVDVNYKSIQTLRYQKTRLTSNGTESETDSVNGVFIIPSTRHFTSSRFSVGWRDTSFLIAAAQSDSQTLYFGLNTSYRDLLGFAVSYSDMDSENLPGATTVENTSFSVGLNWNIIPYKLMWTGKYEEVESAGSSTDSDEQRVKTSFRYVLNGIYTFYLAWEAIDYSDNVSTLYNYTQNIIRTGVEWNF